MRQYLLKVWTFQPNDRIHGGKPNYRWKHWCSITTALWSLLCASECTAFQEVHRPEEPKVAERSNDAVQAIPSFKIPDRWHCELAAAEPEVANPVAFFLANDGTVYVCETFRQDLGVTDNRGHDRTWLLADLQARTVQDRIDYYKKLLSDGGASFERFDDRIRKLVDRDGDGVYEESTVFANGFYRMEEGTGAGVLVHEDDVFYTCIPKLWRLKDESGDGTADQREALYDGFGVRVAFRGHDLHGLVVGPDGRLYFSIGDRGYHVATPSGILADPNSGAVFRCELDGSNLEVVATGLRNPQELAFDAFGNLFTGDNNSDSGDQARWVYVLEGADSGWRMYYQYIPDRGPFNREKIWHPFHQETPAYVFPPVANVGDGPSGLTYYPGTGFGDELQNTFLLVDFRGQASNSGVRSIRLDSDGAFFKLVSNEPLLWNILATDADFGPDGNLYVSDWVNGWTGEGRGRLYRFSSQDHRDSEIVQSTSRILRSGTKDCSDETLQSLLQHPDRRVRQLSQWELVKRERVELLLRTALNEELAVEHRLHGVWGLGLLARGKTGRSEEAKTALEACLTTGEPWVVSRACSAIADCQHRSASETIIGLILHSDAKVRAAAALAAGRMKLEMVVPSICTMLEENGDRDPAIRHAGIMALTGQPNREAVAQLIHSNAVSVRRAAVVALRRNLDLRIIDFLLDPEPSIVLEAARAIYDLPAMEAGLMKLASMLNVLPSDSNLLRRAINANYRIGDLASARRIADFAADARWSEQLRIEALERLRSWEYPDPLDGITGEFRPIEARGSEAARTAMREKLAALVGSSPPIQGRAMSVAASLELIEVVPTLTKVITNRSASGVERADALRGLASLSPDDARKYIEGAISDPSPPVRVAAFQLLSSIDPQQALLAIRRATKSDVVFERQAAWDALKSLQISEADAFLEEGAKLYFSKNLPRDVMLNVREAVLGRLHGEVAEQLRETLEAIAQQTETDPVAAYQDAVEGGDAMAGRELFFFRSQLSCVRCHKVAGRGGDVGPDLTRIAATKDRNYLLESIVAPSAKIAENYESIILITEDDEVVTGILRHEDESTLALMMADGTQRSMQKDSIVARKNGPSSMPADLMKYLTVRELRDLVAYLAFLNGKNEDVLHPGEFGGHAVK